MSDTVTDPPPTVADQQQITNSSLWTPQTVIAMAGVLIIAGTIIGVFLRGDAPTLQLVVGIIIGSYGGDIFKFYFGSSKGSQDKDTTNAKVQERLATTAAKVAVAMPVQVVQEPPAAEGR